MNAWLYGLAAAFIGGGATAVTGGVSVSAISPTTFNFGDQLVPTMKLMVVLFLLNGVLSAFAYLKQSPLPAEEKNSKSIGAANSEPGALSRSPLQA